MRAEDTSAQSRWDGRCHVPIFHHTLIGWPPALPSGSYVIAATSEPADAKGRNLRVLAVLGTTPNDKALLDAAEERICATVADGDESDRGCLARREQR